MENNQFYRIMPNKTERKPKFYWEKLFEEIDNSTSSIVETHRTKIIGGWLLRTLTFTELPTHGHGSSSMNVSMLFIADPNHEWDIKSDYYRDYYLSAKKMNGECDWRT